MLDWKTWFGAALTGVKDFYVEHPQVTMFGLGAITTALIFMLIL